MTFGLEGSNEYSEPNEQSGNDHEVEGCLVSLGKTKDIRMLGADEQVGQ